MDTGGGGGGGGCRGVGYDAENTVATVTFSAPPIDAATADDDDDVVGVVDVMLMQRVASATAAVSLLCGCCVAAMSLLCVAVSDSTASTALSVVLPPVLKLIACRIRFFSLRMI